MSDSDDDYQLEEIELPPTYKKRVRAVATIDMGIASFMICYYVYRYILHTMHSSIVISEPEDYNLHMGEIRRELMISTIWAGIFTGHGLELFMAIVLYSATQQKCVEAALWKCKIWYRTSLILLVLVIIEIYVILSIEGLRVNFLTFQALLKTVFRISASYIVRSSTGELSELVTQQIIELASMVTDGETVNSVHNSCIYRPGSNGESGSGTRSAEIESAKSRDKDREVTKF